MVGVVGSSPIAPTTFLRILRSARTAGFAALGVFATACALSFTSPWELAEHRIFDLLTRAAAPQRSELPISIIGIDEASFAQIGRQWPWPRSMFAQLIDRLRERGAAVVALDLVL